MFRGTKSGFYTTSSIAAFLFTYPDGDLSKPAIKLRKYKRSRLALPVYALPMRCPVLTYLVLAQVGGSSLACIDDPEVGLRYAMCGTELAYGTALRYAKWSTELGYGWDVWY
eukprot:1758576-Rhodomonas_salina.2